MSTVRDAVLLAAETLEEHPERWMQGDLFEFHDESPDVVHACAIGMCVTAGTVLGVTGVTAVDMAHEDAFGIDLIDFNDNEASSAAEVAARLRELAERL